MYTNQRISIAQYVASIRRTAMNSPALTSSSNDFLHHTSSPYSPYSPMISPLSTNSSPTNTIRQHSQQQQHGRIPFTHQQLYSPSSGSGSASLTDEHSVGSPFMFDSTSEMDAFDHSSQHLAPYSDNYYSPTHASPPPFIDDASAVRKHHLSVDIPDMTPNVFEYMEPSFASSGLDPYTQHYPRSTPLRVQASKAMEYTATPISAFVDDVASPSAMGLHSASVHTPVDMASATSDSSMSPMTSAYYTPPLAHASVPIPIQNGGTYSLNAYQQQHGAMLSPQSSVGSFGTPGSYPNAIASPISVPRAGGFTNGSSLLGYPPQPQQVMACDPRSVSGSPPERSAPISTGFTAFGSPVGFDAEEDVEGSVEQEMLDSLEMDADIGGEEVIEDDSGESEREDSDDSDYVYGRASSRKRTSPTISAAGGRARSARAQRLAPVIVPSHGNVRSPISPESPSSTTSRRRSRAPQSPASPTPSSSTSPTSLQNATLPVPIPNLTKKSRGRRVPTQSSVIVTASGVPKNSRAYVCKVQGCGKCFARGEHLKRHIRSIHTYEKPHRCPVPSCAKEFSRHDNLCQHMRVHRNFTGPVPIGNNLPPNQIGASQY